MTITLQVSHMSHPIRTTPIEMKKLFAYLMRSLALATRFKEQANSSYTTFGKKNNKVYVWQICKVKHLFKVNGMRHKIFFKCFLHSSNFRSTSHRECFWKVLPRARSLFFMDVQFINLVPLLFFSLCRSCTRIHMRKAVLPNIPSGWGEGCALCWCYVSGSSLSRKN